MLFRSAQISADLSARILAEGGVGAGNRLRWAWRRALQRDPRPEEVRVAEELLAAHLPSYRADPAAAAALVATGQSAPAAGLDAAEWAAWTHVARVLLNLHELITRS